METENKFLVMNEINKMNLEKDSIKNAIYVDKENYARQLRGPLGEKIREYLKKPRKVSFWQKIRFKLARWYTIRRNTKMAKKRGGQNYWGQ